MRYGYHTEGNYYGQYYQPTKIHAFEKRSDYLPICGTIISYVQGRSFVATHKLSFAPNPDRNSCQNCLRILVSRYVKT